MKKKNGFSLVEILAVIVILSIVATMATFSVMKTRENSMKKLLNTKIDELEQAPFFMGKRTKVLLKVHVL